ncbi:MAG: hypothetical protein ACRES2_05830, partial [Steroidobacteraceae bacterium]
MKWAMLVRCGVLLPFLACGPLVAQQSSGGGPEDVPPDNRFDTARMDSSLVVPRTAVSRFRYAVIDAHSHDVYTSTPEQLAAWVRLQSAVGVDQTCIFTGKSGEDFKAAVERYAHAYPDRFLMFAGISSAGIDTPGYGELLR